MENCCAIAAIWNQSCALALNQLRKRLKTATGAVSENAAQKAQVALGWWLAWFVLLLRASSVHMYSEKSACCALRLGVSVSFIHDRVCIFQAHIIPWLPTSFRAQSRTASCHIKRLERLLECTTAYLACALAAPAHESPLGARLVGGDGSPHPAHACILIGPETLGSALHEQRFGRSSARLRQL